MMDGFSRNGYILFRSGDRGHGSSEGEARGGYSTPAYSVDVLNGMAAVKTLEVANTDRIGMWGHSASFNTAMQRSIVYFDTHVKNR
jgi:uncharacterized protein